MNLRKLSLTLGLALFAATAHAQVAVYGTVTVNHISGVHYLDSLGTHTDGSADPIGGTGGIYYDFRKLGPARLGVDVRGSIITSKQGVSNESNGGGTRINSVLGGVRAAFPSPIQFLQLKPYLQVSLGLGQSNYGYTARTLYSNFQYMGFAGVDIKLLPVMDFRLVELGYGGLVGGPDSKNYPLGSISSGLVFHFPVN